MENTAKYFFGAVSDKGFISHFGQLQEDNSLQLLILKGGPGCGKSTLMRNIAEYAASLGHNLEFVLCASDTDSLDAIIDKTAGLAIIDGTAPHTEDPSVPGVRHNIINMGEFWNSDILKKKAAEIDIHSAISKAFHQSAASYIGAAGALLRENTRRSLPYVLPETAELAFEIMKDIPDGDVFSVEKRLLSAVTSQKIYFLEETARLFADNVYVVEDDFGGASEVLFQNLIQIAKLKKMKTVICPCSVLRDKTDHIIFPDARVAVLKGNGFLPCTQGQKISVDALYSVFDKASLRKASQDAKKLLDTASYFIRNAKKEHLRLEKIYVSAMDFSKTKDLPLRIKRDFYA